MTGRDVRRGSGAGTMLVLLVVSLLHAAPPAEAQEREGRIVGRVTDFVGNAVAGASVVLARADSARPARTAKSGETGGFEFARLAPGSYTVVAHVPGRAAAPVRVEVGAGERRTVIARLSASAARPRLVEERRTRGAGRP
jgi:Carboxypeptidase regulatory-like domain